MALKRLSYNVRRLNSPFKRSLLWKDIVKSNADIICLQETHLASPDVPKLKHKLFLHVFHSALTAKKAGTAIAIRNTVAFKLIDQILDPKGRYTVIVCEIDLVRYTIASIYAPNTRQLSFLRSTIRKIKACCFGKLLLAGDFNAVSDKILDRTQGCARSALEIRSILNEENLHDIWRYQNSNEKDFTYFSPSKGTHSRIDMILTDSPSLESALRTSIGYITWSDHAPVTLTLSNGPILTGNSPWCLNTFLIKSTNIIEEVRSTLVEYFTINEGSVSSPSTLWCAHKSVLRGIFLKIGAREKKKRLITLHALLADLKSADASLKTSPTLDNQTKFSTAQEKLRVFYLQDYEKSLKRLKLNFYSGGDKAGKFLANRVKILQARNKIPYISSNSENKIHDPRLIADAFAYYSSLYNLHSDNSVSQPSSESVQAFLQMVSLPELYPPQLELLNAPITISEISKVIDSAKYNKSPGPDGLSNEYYKTFKSTLAAHLL